MKKQLSNEELVEQIRSGRKVSENMETLYKNNLPLIRQFIRPFIYFEPEQDLLQQAYIGLWTATTHYESGENVRFMTYAQFWIQQDIRRYLENCGSIIRIPPHNRQKVIRYKKLIRDYERDHGREPTDQEAAACLGEKRYNKYNKNHHRRTMKGEHLWNTDIFEYQQKIRMKIGNLKQ